jgi:hypothetical protein
MKTLRLLVTKNCDKNCEGCCNKDWDVDSLPIVEHFNYDEILITGGEPLSDKNIEKTMNIINGINTLFPKEGRKIYVYTSNSFYSEILYWCDGITLSIHTQKDLDNFLLRKIWLEKHNNKSLRLNIFKGINLPKKVDLSNWKVKGNIEWIKNCPLPENEVFMRLQNIE